jgi:hypothetical protein
MVEDFIWTYTEHNGDVLVAAHRLDMKASSLARTLYRAKKRGYDITFLDTSQRGRKRKA